jgi:hypothetical protein
MHQQLDKPTPLMEPRKRSKSLNIDNSSSLSKQQHPSSSPKVKLNRTKSFSHLLKNSKTFINNSTTQQQDTNLIQLKNRNKIKKLIKKKNRTEESRTSSVSTSFLTSNIGYDYLYSASFIDLINICLRYKDTLEQLVDLVCSKSVMKQSQLFAKYHFNLINGIYYVINNTTFQLLVYLTIQNCF